jgi:hypothetical protein
MSGIACSPASIEWGFPESVYQPKPGEMEQNGGKEVKMTPLSTFGSES